MNDAPLGTVAGFNGTCPLCNRYIVAKRSWIKRLPEPIRHPDWWHDDDEHPGYAFGFWDHGPTPWVHAACYETWAKQNSPQIRIRVRGKELRSTNTTTKGIA